MDQSAFELIYDVVRQIPKGKVATYGQVAALAGNRRWSRLRWRTTEWIWKNIDGIV